MSAGVAMVFATSSRVTVGGNGCADDETPVLPRCRSCRTRAQFRRTWAAPAPPKARCSTALAAADWRILQIPRVIERRRFRALCTPSVGRKADRRSEFPCDRNPDTDLLAILPAE